MNDSMPCVLRAYGRNFSVNTFLKKTKLKVFRHWIKGTERDWVKRCLPPNTRRSFNKLFGKHFKDSGVYIDVSKAEFKNFKAQTNAATRFLKKYQKELKRLRAYPGIERVYLDFWVADLPEGIMTLHFALPEALLILAGQLRIHIVISQYAIDEG